MAILYKTDDTQETVAPTNGKRFTLEELQTFVGGFIQVIEVPIGGKWVPLVLNEEGKLEGLPFNKRGTSLGRLAGIMDDDYIVGDVVLCDGGEMDDDGEEE